MSGCNTCYNYKDELYSFMKRLKNVIIIISLCHHGVGRLNWPSKPTLRLRDSRSVFAVGVRAESV